MILGVDTSLSFMSVALLDGGSLLGGVVLEGKDSRNEKLLPAIDWLLRENGRTLSDLVLVAVTRGPGSFTGVRIALATVQGLGLALGIPICGFSTHQAAAYSAGPARVLVHSNAGRNEHYVAAFEGGHEIQAPALMSAASLQALRESYEAVIDLDRFAGERNVAQCAAALAFVLREASRLEEINDLTPIYVRLAEAEVRLAGGSQ
jgi:tRNA threonylcarbamoyladenosine biosynthesis protein TsaB